MPPQQYSSPPATTIDPNKSYTATIKTSKGIDDPGAIRLRSAAYRQ